jgi:hypothetical protein
MISQNAERKKPSKIQDNFEEVDNLVLNYKIDLESLMTARFDGNFVDMTTNFAVNCVTKSIKHILPQNDDCRLLQNLFTSGFYESSTESNSKQQ